MTTFERFMKKVRISFSGDTDCWEWTGCTSKKGYGRLRYGDCVRPAHQVSYILFVGPIPDGLELDHLCRNRKCVNPKHLEPVTHAENMRRSVRSVGPNLSITHCPQGHEYTPDNTRVDRGARKCKTCIRAMRKRYRDANPEKVKQQKRESYLRNKVKSS